MNLAIRISRFFANMVLAGMAISLGAYVYLLNAGFYGAILFSVGLLAVVHHKFFLYTGKIHTVSQWVDPILLAVILLFNIAGCWLVSLAVNDTWVIQECQRIVTERATLNFPEALFKGAGCGFLITLAVIGYGKSKLTLILCVVAFIMAGFTHSVADAFYYCVGREAMSEGAMLTYLGTVIGNFLGGWIYHLGANTPSK